MRIRSWTFPALLCVLLAPTGVRTEVLEYKSDAERFGAALAVPFTRREVVKRSMEHCAQAVPEQGADSRMAYARWIRRHAGFLQIATRMTRGITEAAAKDRTEKGAQMRQFLEYIPKQIDRTASASVQPLVDLPIPDAKRKMCVDLIAGVDGRRFDIDKTDPDITKYFHRIAGQYGVTLPDAGAETGAEPPTARRDAAALLGKWKAATSTIYFPDGATRTSGPSGCTFEFTKERLISQCAGDKRPSRFVYAYRASDSGRYDAELLESSPPQPLGTRTFARFRVEDGKLHTSVFPPTSGDGVRPVEVEAAFSPDSSTGGATAQ